MYFQKLFPRFLTLSVLIPILFGGFVSGQEISRNKKDTIPDLYQSGKYLGQATGKKDYQSIMNTMDAYFRDYPSMKEEMEETYKHYQRWKYYWKPRMNKIGKEKAGPQYANQMAIKQLKHSMAQGKMPGKVCNQGYDPDWQLLGPKKKYEDQNRGRLISVAVHPNDTNTIYAGSYHSGLYKTTDHGDHWENMTDELRIPGLGINDIAINPNNPQEIFIATGRTARGTISGNNYGVGILKSVDGGETWNSTGLTPNSPQKYMANKVLIDPNNPQTVYAARLDLLFKSTNGGGTWDTMKNFQPSQTKKNNPEKINQIKLHPTNSTIIYVSTRDIGYGTGGGKIWRSTDGANTFQEITPTMNSTDSADIFYIGVTSAAPDFLYTRYSVIAPTEKSVIQKSPDKGTTWKNPSNVDYSSGYQNYGTGQHYGQIVVSPVDTQIIYLPHTRMHESNNGGKNVNEQYDYFETDQTHVDTRDLIIERGSDPSDSGNKDVLLQANDGGGK